MVPSVNILGSNISTLSLQKATQYIADWVKNDERHYVCVCTTHTVMEGVNAKRVKEAINGASMATPDGMPLVWLGKYWGGEEVTRVYGPDLMLSLCEISNVSAENERIRHFFLGGKPEVVSKLTSNLQDKFPKLVVAGTYSPPFREMTKNEKSEMINLVNQSAADIVWVGLGTPKQDLWIAEYREKLDPAVLIAVGAAFDFHAGFKKQAPTWMQKSGFEWLFRLLTEPRRLWKRYLYNNPAFMWLTFLQITKLREFSVED